MKKKYGLIALASTMSFLLVACGSGNSQPVGPVGPGNSNTSEQTQTGEYPESVSIRFENATSDTQGIDAKVAPGATLNVVAGYLPANATKNLDITWTVTPRTALGISTSADGKSAQLLAKTEGDATIVAKMYDEKNNDIVSNTLKVRIEGNHLKNSDFQKGKTTYGTGTNEKPLTINTLYKNQSAPHLDSLNEMHVMIVPFGFQEDRYQAKQTPEMLEKIRLTFSGTAEELAEVGGWESLSSFYKKSSYGKSDFNGEVLPCWVNYNRNAENCDGGLTAAEYTRNWYISEYGKTNHGQLGPNAHPLSYWDSDGDGYIDLMWLVYSHETVNNNTPWWAYVTYSGNQPNKSSPTVKTIGWASIDWMNNGNNGYDAHTFIHETGHTYGLPDFYDYKNTWSPMGGIDFMDHNLGDQCMFSKWSLAWTSPWVVDDDAIITLRPGTSTGDCFVIPSPDFNNTVFDEYMMFELMAPVGLAEADYKAGYQNVAGFSKPGIRITHVDARAYGSSHDTYLRTNPQTGRDYRLDNSYGGRAGLKTDGDYWPFYNAKGVLEPNYMNLTSLMESVIDETTNSRTSKSFVASNASLFTAGQTFSLRDTKGWAKTFMPSKTNLWNKAKTTTGWKSATEQLYEIDETMTFNYDVKVLSIDEDPTYGWTARVQVTPNAY